mmetsp:Transcript_115081/g.320596  ORF Transcript_115081/g.320596 Transcript_115081/m.320596 type:complete len:306 (+) Transcript_115081:1547-2464(+)
MRRADAAATTPAVVPAPELAEAYVSQALCMAELAVAEAVEPRAQGRVVAALAAQAPAEPGAEAVRDLEPHRARRGSLDALAAQALLMATAAAAAALAPLGWGLGRHLRLLLWRRQGSVLHTALHHKGKCQDLCRAWPNCGILQQQPVKHEPPQLRVHAPGQRGHVLGLDLSEEVRQGGGGERADVVGAAHLVEDYTERPDVALLGEHTHALCHLRREVPRRAADRGRPDLAAAQLLGQAEVSYAHAILGHEEDVFTLDVAVQDAPVMEVLQAHRDPHADSPDLALGNAGGGPQVLRLEVAELAIL